MISSTQLATQAADKWGPPGVPGDAVEKALQARGIQWNITLRRSTSTAKEAGPRQQRSNRNRSERTRQRPWPKSNWEQPPSNHNAWDAWNRSRPSLPANQGLQSPAEAWPPAPTMPPGLSTMTDVESAPSGTSAPAHSWSNSQRTPYAASEPTWNGWPHPSSAPEPSWTPPGPDSETSWSSGLHWSSPQPWQSNRHGSSSSWSGS